MKIYGSASSPDFSKLRILIGDYYSPDSYELIYETSNVTSDLIYELSMEDVNLGSNLLKIEVEDIHGQIAFDTFPFYKDCFAGCIYNGNQYFTGIPKLADLNGDGVEEIIFATTDYNVHVIDAEGIELPGWPLHMSSRLGDKASFSIADINSDNLLEIIFATTNGDVHVLEQNASYLPSWPIEIGSYNSNQLTPMVADINNDGKLEIISGLNGEINVYDEQANLIEGWPVEIGSNNFKYMTIGDINSDGNLEIIIPYGGTVYALNSEGDILEGFPLDLYASGIENPTLVDIDNDKKLDLIFQSTEDIYVYNSDGSIKEGWPAPNHNSFAWENNLIVSDVSENGLLEIITTDNDKLRVFSNGGDEIFSYEENFIDLLSVFDIDDDGENEIILEYRNQILTLNFQGIIESEWNYMASNLYKYVTFSDIQQDGIIEIIGFSNDKGIYVFETNGKISQIVDWFTINHDNYNSRNYHFDGDYISPKNLLKNPSLETDIGHDYYPNWDLDDSISGNDLPDGWKYWNGGDAEGIIDYSKSYSGENSFKISLSEIIEEDRNAIYQDVPIIYKNKYKVSGYVKTNCLDENCYGTILTTCRDENHNQIYNCGFHVPEEDIQRVFGNSDWTKIEYILEGTNRDADYIRVYCYHTPWNSEYPNPGAGTVWCDDFKVEELPKPEEELPVITTIRQPLQPKEIQEELDKKTKELPESKQKLSPLQSFWEKILEILF